MTVKYPVMASKIRSWIIILKLITSLSNKIFDLSISRSLYPASKRFWEMLSLYLSVKVSGVVVLVVVWDSELE